MQNGGGKGRGATWRLWPRRASVGCGMTALTTAPFASLTHWRRSTPTSLPPACPRSRSVMSSSIFTSRARRWGRPTTEVEGSWSPNLPSGRHDGGRGRAAVGRPSAPGKKRLEGSCRHRLPLLLCLVVTSGSIETCGVMGITDLRVGRFSGGRGSA